MADKVKPRWDYPFTEKLFSQVRDLGHIEGIETVRQMTGVDTAVTMIKLYSTDGFGGEEQSALVVPEEEWKCLSKLFRFEPRYNGLLHRNNYGDEVLDRFLHRQEWEKDEEKDRREYERLKKKFGDAR